MRLSLTSASRYQQPWVDDKRLKRTKINNYIVYGFIVAGLAVCGYLGYDGANAAKTGDVSNVACHDRSIH